MSRRGLPKALRALTKRGEVGHPPLSRALVKAFRLTDGLQVQNFRKCNQELELSSRLLMLTKEAAPCCGWHLPHKQRLGNTNLDAFSSMQIGARRRPRQRARLPKILGMVCISES